MSRRTYKRKLEAQNRFFRNPLEPTESVEALRERASYLPNGEPASALSFVERGGGPPFFTPRPIPDNSRISIQNTPSQSAIVKEVWEAREYNRIDQMEAQAEEEKAPLLWPFAVGFGLLLSMGATLLGLVWLAGKLLDAFKWGWK